MLKKKEYTKVTGSETSQSKFLAIWNFWMGQVSFSIFEIIFLIKN
jgi:hypothetical protein